MPVHPDALDELVPLREPLGGDPVPALERTDAIRRLLACTDRGDPYPHCPHCGRALLAGTSTRFSCPNGHLTITLPSRWRSVWRRVRAMFAHSRVGARG